MESLIIKVNNDKNYLVLMAGSPWEFENKKTIDPLSEEYKMFLEFMKKFMKKFFEKENSDNFCFLRKDPLRWNLRVSPETGKNHL